MDLGGTDRLRPSTLRATKAAVALLVSATLVVAVAGLVRSSGVPADDTTREPPPSPAAVSPVADVSVADAVSAIAMLRDWDRARSRAWARADVAALRRLYARGARAGVRDVAMLRRWSDRGLRVRRMAMQVLAVTLRVRTDRRIVLLVTDRLADAAAVPVGGGRERALPRDGISTRRLAFRRAAGRWVLAEVYDRPLATTALTSGSANS